MHVTSSDFTPFYLIGYMASLESKSLNWIFMETILMGKNALLCKIKKVTFHVFLQSCLWDHQQIKVIQTGLFIIGSFS